MLNASPTHEHFADDEPGSKSQASSPWLDAAEILRSLREGRETIVSYANTESECVLELQRSDDPSPLPRGQLETLDGLLRGDAQKVIGLEVGCAPSTTALRAKRALSAVGLECSTKSLPTVLLMIAQAAWGHLPLQGRVVISGASPQRRIIAVPRPRARACAVFSPAETQLVEMMIDGTSRKQMSEARRTSTRTIANQLADVYRKLGCSGRTPLLIRLMYASAAAPSTAPGRPSWAAQFTEQACSRSWTQKQTRPAAGSNR